MEVVADSGALYALYDGGDEHHAEVSGFVREQMPTVLIPAPLLGELGYMLGEWLGEAAVVQFLSDVEAGAFRIVDLTPEELRAAKAVLAKHPRLKLGLCDACVVAVAQRRTLDRIFTVDRKHFRVVKNAKGKPFQLAPWDIQ